MWVAKTPSHFIIRQIATTHWDGHWDSHSTSRSTSHPTSPYIHARDNLNCTALHNPLVEGDRDIVDVLLEAGARSRGTCENDRSCLEIAAARIDGKNLLQALLQWQDKAEEEFWDTGDRMAAI